VTSRRTGVSSFRRYLPLRRSLPPATEEIHHDIAQENTALGRLMACAAAIPAVAQDYERVAPKLPEPEAAPQLRASPATPIASGDDTMLTSELRGLVFVPSADHLVDAGVAVPADAIDTSQVPELDDPAFRAELAPFVGKPLSLADLDRIRGIAVTRMRARQRPFVDVSAPAQNIGGGVIQIVVTEFRLGKVEVEGAKHFSPGFIRRTSGLEPGQELELHHLQADLDRLDQNPFLTVDAIFRPGDSTGETDVVLSARDRLPLRAYAGYDNLGVRSLGVDQWYVGANYGNLWDAGHILSYQYTRTFTGRYNSHSASYVAPLPWNDRLLVFGSMQTARPQVPAVFSTEGKSGQLSARYVTFLPRSGNLSHDLQIGYDFKTTNNNLEFAGVQVFGVRAEVHQIPIIYDATITDRLGQTSIQNILVLSPGNVTGRNSTTNLSTLVPGARARYAYDRLLVTRTTRLPAEAVSITRATVQLATDNLPNSEQLGGGGVGSVRGYYSDTALGSKGVLFSQEVRLRPLSLFKDAKLQDALQLGAFFDYAHLDQVDRIPGGQNQVISPAPASTLIIRSAGILTFSSTSAGA
jgi:hemolysin activation/secretion protein